MECRREYQSNIGIIDRHDTRKKSTLEYKPDCDENSNTDARTQGLRDRVGSNVTSHNARYWCINSFEIILSLYRVGFKFPMFWYLPCVPIYFSERFGNNSNVINTVEIRRRWYCDAVCGLITRRTKQIYAHTTM